MAGPGAAESGLRPPRRSDLWPPAAGKQRGRSPRSGSLRPSRRRSSFDRPTKVSPSAREFPTEIKGKRGGGCGRRLGDPRRAPPPRLRDPGECQARAGPGSLRALSERKAFLSASSRRAPSGESRPGSRGAAGRPGRSAAAPRRAPRRGRRSPPCARPPLCDLGAALPAPAPPGRGQGAGSGSERPRVVRAEAGPRGGPGIN